MNVQTVKLHDSERKEEDPRKKWVKVEDEADVDRLIQVQRYGRVRRINEGQSRAVRGK